MGFHRCLMTVRKGVERKSKWLVIWQESGFRYGIIRLFVHRAALGEDRGQEWVLFVSESNCQTWAQIGRFQILCLLSLPASQMGGICSFGPIPLKTGRQPQSNTAKVFSEISQYYLNPGLSVCPSVDFPLASIQASLVWSEPQPYFTPISPSHPPADSLGSNSLADRLNHHFAVLLCFEKKNQTHLDKFQTRWFLKQGSTTSRLRQKSTHLDW